MTTDKPSQAQARSVELLTVTRDDMLDISRSLARALDPDFLNIPGQPVVFSVTGAPGSGKKIISDIVFEELSESVEMLFSGRQGYDEFHLDAFDTGMQLSFIDLGWGFGYQTEALQDAGKKAASTLQAAFMKICAKNGGVAVLQNPREDTPGIHVFIEDGLSDPNTNPRNVTVLENRDDGAALFTAARKTAADRSWIRHIRIDITDETLLQSPFMQRALDDLAEGAASVKKLLLEEKCTADALLARPYNPAQVQSLKR